MNETFIQKLNDWGKGRIPFLFIIDFEMRRPVAFKIDAIDPKEIQFNFRGFTNDKTECVQSAPLKSIPVSFEKYKEGFDKVMRHLKRGDSFLVNYTIPTAIESSMSLKEIYSAASAKYKLLYRDEFIVFSPEPFVRITDGVVSSFPMKGTIDASVKNARQIIIDDKKELSEHITIVDLIRNDLSQVSENVVVEDFRYVEELKTANRNLLQVSSRIAGKLPEDYRSYIGDILFKLLPAGSVSGAPKPRTLEIIQEAEGSDRGYYTGVCGYFDGDNLDSGVMIRFIEKINGELTYRSGGGITAQSNAKDEYDEAIKKVYVPVD